MAIYNTALQWEFVSLERSNAWPKPSNQESNMSLKPLTHLYLKALTTNGFLWRGLLVCCETKKEGKKRERERWREGVNKCSGLLSYKDTNPIRSGHHLKTSFSSVQLLSCVWLFATQWTAACQASLSITNQLPEFTQTHVHCVGDAIQPSHPLSSPSPSAFNLFQWVSSSHQVAKVWSFSFNNSPSNEYSGLISFRMDWLDLLAIQRTLKSLLQHHSSKAILQCSAFFIVQLSYPTLYEYSQTIALTKWTFVGKVMSLLFNMLSRLVITFLPRRKCLLISFTICCDFGAPQNKVFHCFHCFPIYLPWNDGTGCHDLSFLNVKF